MYVKTVLSYDSQHPEQRCRKHIEEVDHACGDNEDEPNALDAELSVLSKFVVKRCRNVLEEDDLLLCKSSDSDLNDGDAAVTKERKSYNEIEERHSAVDQEESDEEAETS